MNAGIVNMNGFEVYNISHKFDEFLNMLFLFGKFLNRINLTSQKGST